MNRYLMFLIVIIICVISACQKSDKSPTGPPEKLTIAVGKNMVSSLAIIADVKGFFREEGLDVNLQVHAFGKLALQSLLDGKADLATVADTPIMFAMMNGAKLSVLATIVSTSMDNAIIARKDRMITSASGIKGRRIGVTRGTSSDYLLDSFLVLNAISPRDVVIINMKPEEISEAIVKGKIDAAAIWNPFLANIRKELGQRGIMLNSEKAYTSTYDIVSMQELTRQRPEAIRRLLRALVKAEGFAIANPGESQQIMSKFSGMDNGLLAELWSIYQLNVSLNQSLLVSLEEQSRWAMKNGLTDRREIPNYLEALYIDGLKSVKPNAVRVIR